MRRLIMMAAVVGMVAVGARDSQAGTLSLTFDLGGSSLTLNPQTDLPVPIPDANGNGLVSGSVNIALNGVNSLGMVTGMGSGTVSNFLFQAVLNQPVAPGAITIVGSINVSQIGMAAGGFDGMQLALGTGQFVNGLSGVVDCMGILCGAAGVAFPVAVNGMIANTAGTFAFNLANLGGGAMLTAGVDAMQGGASIRLSFVGQEVARMFDGGGGNAPEPLQSGMLVLGVTMLAGLAFVLRRRTA